jgi:hypothetical protein
VAFTANVTQQYKLWYKTEWNASGKYNIHFWRGSYNSPTVYLTQDPFFNASFLRRVPVNVTTGTGEAYLIINSTYFNMSEINSDCSDIYLTANFSGTESKIKQWTETCNTSGNTKVWFNQTASATAFIYYKNNTAVSDASDVSVFTCGDDFTYGNYLNTSRWTIDKDFTLKNISGGVLNLKGNNGRITLKNCNMTKGYALQYRFYGITIGGGAGPNYVAIGWRKFSHTGIWYDGDVQSSLIIFDGGAGTHFYNKDSSGAYAGDFTEEHEGLWTIFAHKYANDGGTAKVSLFKNNAEKIALTSVNVQDTSMIPNVELAPDTAPDMLLDYVIVRADRTQPTVAFGAVESSDSEAPTITWKSQTPPNITSTNLFSQRLNISYNITDATAVNTSTVKLYWFLGYPIWENGTQTSANGSINYRFNASTLFYFDMGGSKNYPATYNYKQLTMQNTTHYTLTLGNTNVYARTELKNINASMNQSFFEVMLNSSTATTVLLYFCNSTYTTGNPTTSTNCVNFYTIATSTSYNHTHPNEDYSAFISRHHLAPFNINSSGFIGTVKVTETGWFLVRGKNAPSILIYGVADSMRNASFATTTNSGTSWTDNNSFTLDAHLHQLPSIIENQYFAEACDTLGNCGNSTIYYTNTSTASIPPTSPVVTRPTTQNYTQYSNVQINWTASTAGQGLTISNYTVEVINGSGTATTVGTGITNLNATWNATTYGENYYAKVTAYDSLGQTSFGESDLFNITQYVAPSTNGTTTTTTVTAPDNPDFTSVKKYQHPSKLMGTDKSAKVMDSMFSWNDVGVIILILVIVSTLTGGLIWISKQ